MVEVSLWKQKEKAGHTAHKTRRCERTLEVTSRGFSKDVDSNGLGVDEALDAHERLNEERLGELEVEVHNTHHGDTKVRRAELLRR
jgi:hypothetical protein